MLQEILKTAALVSCLRQANKTIDEVVKAFAAFEYKLVREKAMEKYKKEIREDFKDLENFVKGLK